MTINVVKLSKELTTAGIQHSGCNADGVVWGVDVNRTQIQNQPAVAAIVAAHDPIDYVAQNKAIDKGLRITSIPLFLTSSGLAGRNLSSINNTADRDALMKVICLSLGICDNNSVILSEAPDVIALKK